MSFLDAIRHAMIGYAIQRAGWSRFLVIDKTENAQLFWLNGSEVGMACAVLGDNPVWDLTADDIKSPDWMIKERE